MTTITQISQNQFTIDGIPYYKNFVPHVVGNRIRILNQYDSCFILMPFTDFDQITINGTVHTSVTNAQSALLPVLFTRDSLGGSGSATWGTISGDINTQTDLINLLGATIENYYDALTGANGMFPDVANQTSGRIQFVLDASPDVTGYAYYEYLGTANGDLTDYRRLSEEEQTALNTSQPSEKQTFDATDGQTVFNLTDVPSNIEVYINRVCQIEGVDYTLSTNVLTLTNGARLNSKVVVRKFY